MDRGDFLESLLADLGVSLPAVATALGIDRKTLYNWINDKTSPKKLPSLADYLEIPWSHFRDALDGKVELLPKYRDRLRWKTYREARLKGQPILDETPPMGAAQPDARQVAASVRWLSGQSPQTYREILNGLSPDELKRLHTRVNEYWDLKHQPSKSDATKGRKTA